MQTDAKIFFVWKRQSQETCIAKAKEICIYNKSYLYTLNPVTNYQQMIHEYRAYLILQHSDMLTCYLAGSVI